jgi:hypothetical protein
MLRKEVAFMQTYQNYLSAPGHLTFQEMEKIHEGILEQVNINDSEFKELWEEIIKTAIDYTNMRANFAFLSMEDKHLDSKRTTKHNLFLYAVKDLMIYMNLNELNTEWYNKLNDSDKPRKRVGDFANYLTFIMAVNAR